MNITPLIDVLLVLLVIFLASLPLTEKAIDTSLPAETQAANSRVVDSPQILLEYTADRHISVNHQDFSEAGLEFGLREIYRQRSDKTLYIAGASTLPYRAIIDVMDAAKGAGVQRVGIITDGMRRAAGVQPVSQ